MPARILKASGLALLTTLLTGCLHIQLFGSVSDARITIASIYDRDNIVFEETTTGRELWIASKGQATWDDWGPRLQTWVLGIVATDENTALDDDKIYLVTVHPGGFDSDAADSDRQLDANPALINGSFHSILTGAQIKGDLGKVSLLTELLYQAMFIETGSIDGHDDNWFFVELDKFSDRLVGDLNGDGVVSYEDVLEWTVLFNADEYIGSQALLDQYANQILAGTANDAELFDLAVTVLDSSIDLEHELAGNWLLDMGRGTLLCSDGSATDLASFSETVTVSIIGDEISFPANDWSDIPNWEINSDTGISGSFNDIDNSFHATQTLTGITQINPELGDQTIDVSYSGQFNGSSWAGSYEYEFSITGFDFSCESSQAFSGNQMP